MRFATTRHRVKIAKPFQGGEQDGVPGRGIGRATACKRLGRAGGFQGADGGQPLVVVLRRIKEVAPLLRSGVARPDFPSIFPAIPTLL